jgi:hypothetical protein
MFAPLKQNASECVVAPPERALVLCVDEKSQIQALDRTAPILSLRPGLPERQTHDYKRYGTTTLFAAFNILNVQVGRDLLLHLVEKLRELFAAMTRQATADDFAGVSSLAF